MESDEGDKRAKGPTWRHVYDTLRTEILALTLAPGQPLDETGLAERFGLSRSPVREALIRLSLEELVVTLPNRSTIVAPIEIATFPAYVDALDIAQLLLGHIGGRGSVDHQRHHAPVAKGHHNQLPRQDRRRTPVVEHGIQRRIDHHPHDGGRRLGLHRQRLDLGLHLLAVADDAGEIAERFGEIATRLRLDLDDDGEEIPRGVRG